MIRRDGPQALTLDAVAAEAGVSKGGLLYHFASKRDLLDAVVRRWLDEFQDDIDAAGPGFLAGYVRASDGAKAEEAGLLAALVADPDGAGRRCASGTRRGRIASSRKVATPWRPRWPGWPPTGCGSPTCSGWPRPRASCAPAYWRACSNYAIDSSVNEVASRTSVPTKRCPQ